MLQEWLPDSGLVLEIASGSGEHVVHFAGRFPHLDWQPSDADRGALESIAAYREQVQLPNLRAPIALDAASAEWGVDRASAVLSINMVHISPWEAASGLLDGAVRLLPAGAPLILYGPWLIDGVETAPSNLAFDSSLRARDSRWGLRAVSAFAAEGARRGLLLASVRTMPANNLMLLLRRSEGPR